jgi:hypothetical protein
MVDDWRRGGRLAARPREARLSDRAAPASSAPTSCRRCSPRLAVRALARPASDRRNLDGLPTRDRGGRPARRTWRTRSRPCDASFTSPRTTVCGARPRRPHAQQRRGHAQRARGGARRRACRARSTRVRSRRSASNRRHRRRNVSEPARASDRRLQASKYWPSKEGSQRPQTRGQDVVIVNPDDADRRRGTANRRRPARFSSAS